MNQLPHGSTGCYVAHSDDHDAARDIARLGYDTVWLAGGQITSLDDLAELLAATDTVRIGSGIVPLGVFDVAAIAELYRDAAADHPGRFVLGIGGPQQERPMAALKGYLEELDAAGVPARDRLLAALGPRKLAVAAARSAGAIITANSPAATANARAALGLHAHLVVHEMVAVGSDPAACRDAVRETLSFLSRVGGYRSAFARMGFDTGQIDRLDDALVDAVSAHGDPDAIAARLQQHRAAGADHVAIMPRVVEGGPSPVETAALLAGPLGLGG